MAHQILDKFNNPLMDFGLQMALRNIPGAVHIHKFFGGPITNGAVASVGDVAAVSSIAGYDWLDPSSAGPVILTSTSDEDQVGGDGLDRVHMFGIDTNYDLHDEIIPTNGLGDAVSSRDNYIGVWRMHGEPVLSPNFTGVNSIAAQGNILAHIPAMANPLAAIRQTKGQTLMAQFIVPRGFSALIYFGKVSAPKAQSMEGAFTFRQTILSDSGTPLYGPSRVAHEFDLYQNNYDYPFKFPLAASQRSRLDVQATVEAGTSKISGGYDIVLFPNKYDPQAAAFGFDET